MAARILRALDNHGLLGHGLRVIGTHALYAYEAGLRVIGTHALYAYEAVAGVHFDAAVLATEDVDLLIDARTGMTFVTSDEVDRASLLHILRGVDRSFERARTQYRAINGSGYWVDLVTPMRQPPWGVAAASVGNDVEDLVAAEIEGLIWHENAPAFDAVAIDVRGEPVPMITSDPRVFAAHKHWLSGRSDREPNKRRRDAEQARLVAALVAESFGHLPFAAKDLRMLPRCGIRCGETCACCPARYSRRPRPLFEPGPPP